MSRPQLFKIRRLVRRVDQGKEFYEFLVDPGADPPVWIKPDGPVNDGLAYTDYKVAMKVCEHLKVANRDPAVIYHAVVPV